jgi:hypothetical protein
MPETSILSPKNNKEIIKIEGVIVNYISICTTYNKSVTKIFFAIFRRLLCYILAVLSPLNPVKNNPCQIIIPPQR